jgi:hypothetical protein
MSIDGTEPLEQDDVIDSRDVIARIEYLESRRDDSAPCEWFANTAEVPAWCCNTHMYDGTGDYPTTGEHPGVCPFGEGIEPLTEDEAEELAALLALQDEASGASDWTYGETLIRDDYFKDYAQELAEDIGAINPEASWPLNHIDWGAAADALKMDYTPVEWSGVTYWVRW